jgi:hypothetical protein
MAVHDELVKVMTEFFGAAGVNWTNGTPNATAASASLSAQRLQELIHKASLCGYETRVSSGSLICSPKP